MTLDSDDDSQQNPERREFRGPITGLLAGTAIGIGATFASREAPGWLALGDLPDTIWVAVITTSALVAQGWLAGRREERVRRDDHRERSRDRLAETRRREQERADALAEHWRDERKRAHADLLEAYSLAIDAFRSASSKASLARLFGYSKEDRKPFQDAAAEAHELVEKQLAIVHLLASTSAAKAAEVAVGRLRGVWVMLISFDMYEKDPEKWDESVTKAQERLSTVYEARDAYREAARQDIGTI
ncbi:hypothetical protein ACLM5J_07805 [Nocardioides sp. Bht2]|uniref:hypothetical protein n=1 Tax=Nocardioides sp. Bht2 TaxID=3392297 RepID=UPI0039B465E7